VNAANVKIMVPSKASAALSDLQNGDRVAVQGKPSSDPSNSSGSIDATLILAISNNHDNVFGGIIASINGSKLVLFTRDGQQLTVDATSTVIFERGVTNASLADLKVGRAVGVIGTKNSDGSVMAQLVGQITLPIVGWRTV
jgi:hypothetical protein